jgi:hypothetical protein
MLDSQSVVEALRERMLSDWAGIAALGERLAVDRTVSGAHAFDLLGGNA